MPFELAAGSPYQVIVNANGALSTPNQIQLTSDSPGIAQYAAGQAIAQHVSDNSLITETSPAKPGEYVVFYVAGMGLTRSQACRREPPRRRPICPHYWTHPL